MCVWNIEYMYMYIECASGVMDRCSEWESGEPSSSVSRIRYAYDYAKITLGKVWFYLSSFQNCTTNCFLDPWLENRLEEEQPWIQYYNSNL